MLAPWPRKAGHAQAAVRPTFVQTRAIVEAGAGVTLVYVHLAPRAREARLTPALERAGRVDAITVVLTRIARLLALVHVVLTGKALESGRAGAHKRAVDGTGVTNRSVHAGVAGTGVVQMTQQARLPNWTLAVE